MNLTYQKFLFSIEAQDALSLPYYKGSTFRGGFGNAFRRVVCALKKKECKECMLASRCIYAYIFETSPHEDANLMNMNKYEKIPHPFIIEPPEETHRTYKPGDSLSFNLVLIGRATDYLPYFIFTFEELGKIGIGRGRGKYRLTKVETGKKELVYSSDDKTVRAATPEELYIQETFDFSGRLEKTIKIKFLTPARISYQRSLTADLKFHILIRNLLRRLNLLHYFHCEKTIPAWDHKELIKEAEKISTETGSFRWLDWERYSSRQNVKMKMGGITGEITYKGNMEPFMPILEAGEIVHIGKGTSFGLGRYEISSASG
ncbi:MAG TPA: CRISPR-associated protein Cas6 [Deltaproteobacteria bacterium]|nr:CRISPR-associated protein Cas6 [Deltaproteobacteria bacterium]